MISWLLLSYPIMDTIAFTTKGTMTLDQEDDENFIQKKPKILKRKIIKNRDSEQGLVGEKIPKVCICKDQVFIIQNCEKIFPHGTWI